MSKKPRKAKIKELTEMPRERKGRVCQQCQGKKSTRKFQGRFLCPPCIQEILEKEIT